MLNITCFIVDDEYHALDTLKGLVGETPGLELVGYGTDPLEALVRVTGPERPDLIFLDIHMPRMSGLQFAELTRSHSKIIFTTSYAEYALEAFEKRAFDYLLKPVTRERFLKAVTELRLDGLAIGRPGVDRQDHFYIKTETKGRIARIGIDEIGHVEALANYVLIHTRTAKHLAYLTLSEVEEFLPKADFSKVHRSFIVNNKAITAIEPGQVRLNTGAIVPIGRAFKEAFFAGIQVSLFKSYRDS